MSLELCKLFLQYLQPLLLVGDVNHRSGKLLGLEQLLQLGQLRLLLPVALTSHSEGNEHLESARMRKAAPETN